MLLNTFPEPLAQSTRTGILKFNWVGQSGNNLAVVSVDTSGRYVISGYAYTPLPSNLASARLLSTNGTLDTSYGSAGEYIAPLSPGNVFDSALETVLQPDDKLVFAGYTQRPDNSVIFLVARMLADGGMDGSFGTGGFTNTSVNGIYEGYNAVALQADGKIVTAGESYTLPDFTDRLGVVSRYTTAGVLDSTFGTGGIVVIDFHVGIGIAGFEWIGVQPDNKIVVSGLVVTGGQDFMMVVRLNPNGSLDTSFGTGGITVLVTGGDGSRPAVGLAGVILPSGKILLAGDYKNNISGLSGICVVRFNTDGSLDGSFGVGGVASVITANGHGLQTCTGLKLQSSGKMILVATTLDTPPHYGPTCALRLNVDGSLDTSWGTNGITLWSAYGLERGSLSGFGCIVVPPNDHIVVASAEFDVSFNYFGQVAWLTTSGQLDNTFGDIS